MTIAGGAGGSTTDVGSGGGGGAGALINGILTNVQKSSIIGGNGGSTAKSNAGAGGGGDGVAVVGVGSRFENYGTVTGGAGGQNTADASYSANGGAGIRIGHDAYVVNAGTVTAGASYGTGPATSAIMIVGDNATLELRDGSNIVGGITVADGVTGATLALGGDTTGGTFAGMSGYNGFENFTKTGAATWKVTGEIVANTVKIDQGMLQIENGGSFSVTSLQDNGTLAFNQTANLTVSAAISGSGGFSKMGSNTLTLSGANTFSGNIQVEGGTLLAGSTGAFGTGAGTMDVFTGATVDVGGYNVTMGGLTGGGTIALGGKGMTVNSTTQTTFTGNITASAGSTFVKQGTGTFIMEGNLAAYGVTISGGTLQFTNGGTMSNATAVTDNGTLAFNTTQTLTQAAKVSGNGKLDVFGTGGKLILTADNDYTGLTTIGTGATLQLGDGGTTGSIGNSTLANGGTLAFNHSNAVTQSAAITGNGGLQQLGTGTLILAADNTYTGATTIAAGSTLQLGNGGTTGSIATSSAVTDNGTLAINRSGTVTLQNAISGSGSLNQMSNGTLVLTGNNSYAGATAIAGTLQVGNNGTTGTLGAGAVTVANGGKLSFSRTDSGFTVANAIGGAGNLLQNAGGTTTLTGINSYTGTTTIDASGRLNIGSGGTTGALGTGTVSNAGTLAFNRSDAYAAAAAIGGAGQLIKMAAGTLTLSGANSFTGGLNVQAGSVKAGSATAFGSGALTLAASTSADLNGNDISLSGIEAAAGSTVALGAKKLTLTGNSNTTFAGAMTGTAGSAFDKQGNGVFTATGDIGAYAVTISNGTLQLGNGSTNGWLTKATSITDNGVLIVNRSDDKALSAIISGNGSLTKSGAGTLTLSGVNTYKGGTTVNGGTISVAAANNLGSASNDLFLIGGTLQATNTFTLDQEIKLGAGGGIIDTQGSGTTLTLSNAVAGKSSLVRAAEGSLTKIGDGTLVVLDDIVADTSIQKGTVRIGDSGTKGDIKGAIDIASGATLEFDHSSREIDTDTLSGAGLLRVDSPGAYVMKGNSSGFTGTVEANGSLVVDNSLGASAVTVSSNGDLSGSGSIAGNVTVQSNGHLKGTQGQTLNIGGNLTLSAGSITDISLGTYNASSSELFNVTGNLTLGGVLNVENLGGFGPGIYHIIKYGGSVTGSWTLGDTGGFNPVDLSITTSGNYVSLDSQLLDGNARWNGDQLQGGGDGTWDAGSATNWTDGNGANNGYLNNRFAEFDGAPGTVTVDNTANGQVVAGGLQFASGDANDGYLIEGGDLQLATSGNTDTPIIRVGDGTVNSVNIVATIDSNLTGDHGFEKTDLGTLILTHDNDITGDIKIEAGTLQLGDGHSSGSVTGDITVGTGDDYDAHLVINRSDNPVFGQVISGTGTLEQAGTGTTILTGDNTYTGGTFITDGNLQIGDRGATGSIVGDVHIDNPDSKLIVDLSSDITLDGTISGPGGLTQQGTGITTLTSDNDYTGQTVISDGELHLKGDGSIEASSGLTNDGKFDISEVNGDSSTIQSLGGGGGVTLGDKTLIIADGKDSDVFSGIIEGNGRLEIGGGTQHLTGDNTYTGGTKIDETGTLVIGDGGTNGSVKGDIVVDGTLIYDRSDPFVVNPITGDGDVKFEGGGAATIDTEQQFTGELEIEAGNTIIVKGDGDISDADGVTVDGTLDVKDSNKSDIEIGHLRGGEDGLVDLGDKNIVITNGDGSEFSGTIEGDGGFTVEQGKQILSGENTYTGETLIKPDGELQLGNDQHPGKIDSDVTNEGILSGDGTMNNLLNKGEVSPGIGDKPGTLEVNGNYSSEGGRLVLHENLNGDTNSPGDRLNIAGNTSGTTDVKVVALQPGTHGELTDKGIEVITVGGNSDGQFNLIGNYVNYRGAQAVVGGAYAYTLEKGSGADAQGRAVGSDGNWYLRSQMQGYQPPELTPDTPTEDNPTPDNPTQDNPTPTKPSNPGTPEYQAGVPLYSAATSALASLNRTGFASFNTRYKAGENGGSKSGDTQGQNADDLTRSTYFWSRVQGGYSFYTPNGNATGSTYGSHNWSVEAGVDGQFMEGDNGSLIGSAWVDYTRSQINTSSQVGNGRVNVNGYGIGGALTWYGDNGIYVDGQAKATWYTSDMNSDIASEEVASGVKSFGYAMSLEAGKEFTFNDRWSVTPQAQLIWSSLNTDDYDDIFKASVNTPSVQSLTGRLGLAANYATNWQAADGTGSQLTLGGIINVYQELKGGADYIMVSGERVATGSIDKTWGEIGVTANYSWANDVYSVFGKMATASSLQNFGDSYSVTGNVGVRVKW
ncbi:autotransporter outer membrane beta-barrel domain-containing protein [Brucella haematophila]|nr:autotransporter outer membrane beta-barrel domain-containing protein [Brucella haematophila]